LFKVILAVLSNTSMESVEMLILLAAPSILSQELAIPAGKTLDLLLEAVAQTPLPLLRP
jgi:hypothetical protein